MAKAVATISGVALAPGASRNSRLYTKEAIGKMVARASERIAAGKRPIAMYSSHDSADVADIGGVLTRIWQEDDGSAHYTADVPDTPTGRAVVALADTSDGTRFLRGVSILGNWVGGERHEQGPDGKLLETGSDFELARLDFTSSPGVDAAGIDALKTAGGDGEGTGEYAISESAPEALVTTVNEETGAQPVREDAAGGVSEAVPEVAGAVREAVRAVFAPAEAHVLENGLCVTCGDVEEAKRTRNTKPYGDVTYADNGFQKDKVKRYPLDSPAHIRAAWSYINMPKNAAKYTAEQLRRIKSRIKAAMKRIGAKVTGESDVVGGFVIGEAVQAPEAVLEWLGDSPSRAGSWSVSASNGPVNLSLSSYCMDPADLDVILRAAAAAACDALKKLDPDLDGDVDVDGAGPGSDTDGDSGGGESTAGGAPEETTPPASEAAPDAAEEDPAPAGTQEREDSAMPETSTTEAGGAAQPGLTLDDITKATTEAAAAAARAVLEDDRKTRRAAKKERREAAEKEAREKDARKAALAEALADLGIPVPGQAAEGAGAATGGGGGSTAETEEDRVQRLATEQFRTFVQEAVASGAVIPGRNGIQVREDAVTPEDMPENLHELSDDDFKALAGGALDKYLGDSSTRIQAVHT